MDWEEWEEILNKEWGEVEVCGSLYKAGTTLRAIDKTGFVALWEEYQQNLSDTRLTRDEKRYNAEEERVATHNEEKVGWEFNMEKNS